jgi:hypothetical protein
MDIIFRPLACPQVAALPQTSRNLYFSVERFVKFSPLSRINFRFTSLFFALIFRRLHRRGEVDFVVQRPICMFNSAIVFVGNDNLIIVMQRK